MCMPVMPKSSRPAHLYEAASYASLHDIRIAMHLIEQCDRQNILDKVPGPLSIQDFEAYLASLTREMLGLVRSLHSLRENVLAWRAHDEIDGSNEYVI